LRLLISWTWRDLMFALCTLLLASPNVYTFPVREPASSDDLLFPKDHLTPYPEHRHGSRRTARDVSECQHIPWREGGSLWIHKVHSVQQHMAPTKGMAKMNFMRLRLKSAMLRPMIALQSTRQSHSHSTQHHHPASSPLYGCPILYHPDISIRPQDKHQRHKQEVPHLHSSTQAHQHTSTVKHWLYTAKPDVI